MKNTNASDLVWGGRGQYSGERLGDLGVDEGE